MQLCGKSSRARKVIGNFLSGFKGAIKTDGYNAYKIHSPQVQELRKEKSVPILGDLYSKIESLYHDKLTRYSDLLRKAINYAYHEWKAVVRYIENGNWSIDNNEGERRMKPVVLGRKNYMNYGSHQGASNGVHEVVIAIANLIGLTDDKIYDAVINDSEELDYVCDIYKLKRAS